MRSIYPKGENSADFAEAKPSERVQCLLVNQKGLRENGVFFVVSSRRREGKVRPQKSLKASFSGHPQRKWFLIKGAKGGGCCSKCNILSQGVQNVSINGLLVGRGLVRY